MTERIPWWEWDELSEHLASRQDIWDRGSAHQYMRLVDDEPVMGLLCLPPKTTGPYRTYTVTAVPIIWTDDACTSYLKCLLKHYTSFQLRQNIAALIRSEDVKAHPDTAALAISRMYWDPELSTPDDTCVQPCLDGLVDAEPVNTAPNICTHLISSGGYIHLYLQDNLIRAHISVPSHKAYGGGFGAPLSGIVHSPSGSARLTAAMLAGWELQPSPQLELPLEET